MQLNAQKREVFGKKTKSLRENRLIPAVIFGKGMESVPVSINYVDFVRVNNKAGETNVIDLMVDGTEYKVLTKGIAVHPVTSTILHVDFHKVNLKEKISATIPVEIVGEEKNPLVKNGQGLVLVLLNEIDVEALPTDLPNNFTVDVSGLVEIDQGITVKELNYDRSKVEIKDYEDEDLVVKIGYAVQEEIVEETEEDALSKIEATEETAKDETDEGSSTDEKND
ncbi:50S ribosomal protein L25 [Candidatus Nomurabacteria bacterium]|uniref:Large ribosomal subunit protein bL25 n=1 Tax=candidate division WWE3 bacterium TaxID=2053526 RepID=A0A955E114_UNCKA|nr:50S ribosomal protein L25 [candidate division WWE3 bacterium]MCB9823491.1 50S ribosomal protein L25 [Candidatus Nomurabacteria bacterium]MCB9827773.1 50S ribosomal protein L25 [Candidatus Nomurabacteria bacterium]HXK52378.1 50S ribosomal protein L25 [bacterium]